MRFSHFLILNWLLDNDKRTNTKNSTSIFTLIFAIIIFYIPLLILISLITSLFHIENYALVFQIFTIGYGIFGLVLIITDIIYKIKNIKK